MSREYETEPVPGLPELLPEGEALLWQGAPSWAAVARHIYHAGLVAAYFAVLIAWRIVSDYSAGDSLATAVAPALWIAAVGAAALGLMALLARLTARTTIYSITSRRVVMRYGIAMPISVNIPYSIITAAGLNIHGDESGDLPLTLTGSGNLAYLHLWPHARPWHLTKTEPMLRCLAEPASVANILSKALSDANPASERSLARTPEAPASMAPTSGHGAAATA